MSLLFCPQPPILRPPLSHPLTCGGDWNSASACPSRTFSLRLSEEPVPFVSSTACKVQDVVCLSVCLPAMRRQPVRLYYLCATAYGGLQADGMLAFLELGTGQDSEGFPVVGGRERGGWGCCRSLVALVALFPGRGSRHRFSWGGESPQPPLLSCDSTALLLLLNTKPG